MDYLLAVGSNRATTPTKVSFHPPQKDIPNTDPAHRGFTVKDDDVGLTGRDEAFGGLDFNTCMQVR
jgi:hypothetical protein